MLARKKSLLEEFLGSLACVPEYNSQVILIFQLFWDHSFSRQMEPYKKEFS